VKVVVLIKTAHGAFWSVPMSMALRDRGHDVEYALPATEGPLPDQVRDAGMTVLRAEAPLIGSGPLRQPAAIWRLRRQLEELRPDVVVSHLYASALAGRLATWRSSIPHVYMAPGPIYLESPAIRLAERFLCRLDTHLIASSAALEREYQAIGMPEDRLTFVPYALDPAWSADYVTTREDARRQLDIDPDVFVATCVAMFYAPKRLVHRGRGIKGHDVLLPAWARFKARGGVGELLVVGSGFGPGGDEYRGEIRRRFDWVEGVRWVDRVADVRPYYRASDLSVSPSLTENHGAAAEAAALGVPIVASAVGGLPEVVEAGRNGWLVPPNDVDALSDALTVAAAAGATERARLGANARRKATELFDPVTNGEAFADIVEAVARDGSVSRHRRNAPEAAANRLGRLAGDRQ
jgi:glycosyltransferase involved in cell wall biosynthesis